MLLFLLLSACDQVEPDPLLIDRIAALPGVLEVEVGVSPDPSSFEVFRLQFEQPLDHDDPSGDTFVQHLTLQHRGLGAPMVLRSTGYHDYAGGSDSEPSWMIEGNQVTIEHRFYGNSRPEEVDWTLLTMGQSSADMHAVVQSLGELYGGNWLSTGASKGGETVLHHRSQYPDDVVGTLAYVAPLLIDQADDRQPDFFQTVGDDAACRQQVRDVQRDLLEHRADVVASLDTEGFGRVDPSVAVAWSIGELEWYFWQYSTECRTVPTPGDLDDEIELLHRLGSPYGYTDRDIATLLEQYVYQSFNELGAPAVDLDHLQDLRTPADDDLTPLLPDGIEPPYDRSTILDLLDWVATEGEGLMLIYGEYDPWTRYAVPLGAATDSASYLAPKGHHGSWIADLQPSDRDAALEILGRWADTPAQPTWARRISREAPPPREPPRVGLRP